MRIPELYITESELHGRGVFTGVPIAAESLIEICPVLVLPAKDMEAIKSTALYDYYFDWGENNDQPALALGHGSIYNHSYEPNARYLADFEQQTLSFYALRDIEAGEEIRVNYLGLPGEKGKLWFVDKGESKE